MLAKNLPEALEYNNMFTLKFHMFVHILEAFLRFGALNFLHVSPSEHFCYIIKKFLKITSMQRGRKLEKVVKVINASVPNGERRTKTGGEVREAQLVGDDTSFSLVENAASSLASLAHIGTDGRGVLAS